MPLLGSKIWMLGSCTEFFLNNSRTASSYSGRLYPTTIQVSECANASPACSHMRVQAQPAKAPLIDSRTASTKRLRPADGLWDGRNARPGLAATDDGEVRAECGECLCRRQPNAIGGTRDQDLLVVHGTAIQGYGHTRMSSIVKDLALDQSLTNGRSERGSRCAPASRSSSSTRNHTPIGAFKVRGCFVYF